MIRNVESHDKTDCVNQQSTAQVTHEKNKTTCIFNDNTEKTHNNLSWFIWFATYKLECNSQTSEMI